jgi:hypothetical protein
MIVSSSPTYYMLCEALVIGALFFSLPVSAQITTVTDQQGRRFFVNSDRQPIVKGHIAESRPCSASASSLSDVPRDSEPDESDASSPELENLVRKYTSALDLKVGKASLGKIRLVWLGSELLRVMVQRYADTNHLSAVQTISLKKKLARKLELDQAVPFLIIVQPGKDSVLGSPVWASSDDGKKQSPAAFLSGTANRIGAPYKWSQILGEGEEVYYTQPVWGYLVYKARDTDGQKLVHPDDFSFSVRVLSYAAMCTPDRQEKIYDLDVAFHYDLMPIQFQQVIDKSVPSWNNAVANLIERPVLANSSSIDVRTSSGTYPVYYAQGSATSLSRSEILQIVGLAIAFAQLLVAL